MSQLLIQIRRIVCSNAECDEYLTDHEISRRTNQGLSRFCYKCRQDSFNITKVLCWKCDRPFDARTPRYSVCPRCKLKNYRRGMRIKNKKAIEKRKQTKLFQNCFYSECNAKLSSHQLKFCSNSCRKKTYTKLIQEGMAEIAKRKASSL